MADREGGEGYDVVPSAVFALILPTAVDRLRLVAVGDLSWLEMDRGGFGVSVFVWLAHVAALAFAALAARAKPTRATGSPAGASRDLRVQSRERRRDGGGGTAPSARTTPCPGRAYVRAERHADAAVPGGARDVLKDV